MSAQLISISKLITMARAKNVSLGTGDPEEHLFYLGKLGLIPRATKRKVAGKLEGHYPERIISILENIAVLKNKGLPYSQMKLVTEPVLTPSPVPESNLGQSGWPRVFYSAQIFTASPAIFLLIGLSIGYFLTNSSFSRNPVKQNNNPTSSVNIQTGSLTPEEQALVRLVQSPDLGSQDRIYVISSPQNSLGSLGKATINLD